ILLLLSLEKDTATSGLLLEARSRWYADVTSRCQKPRSPAVVAPTRAGGAVESYFCHSGTSSRTPRCSGSPRAMAPVCTSFPATTRTPDTIYSLRHSRLLTVPATAPRLSESAIFLTWSKETKLWLLQR